ncbi:ribophorin I [Opisthorchis viverrini]|uniref:Dolichyl-diphosphooligosaccharide--protein glycosyltransferase subunit 1 n=1 Tax=Opisthorchis viverrini TaxID=6198 RepID=A0A1S8WWK4_OPIVI|nr:ribophorin I [Opisthorchis viverrini]
MKRLALPVVLFFLGWVSGLKNLDVTRVIDLESSVVRVEHAITLDEPTDDYEFHIHPSETDHVSSVSAWHGKNKDALEVRLAAGKSNVYRIGVKKSSTPIQFTVAVVLTNVLEPKPAEILQAQSQFVKYTGNVMFFTPYTTERQKTTVVLPQGELLRYTSAPEPITKQPRKLEYGPYEGIGAFTHNTGAKLKGPFSRLDFDMGVGQRVAISSFKTALPAAARDIYYRDDIGNISTSAVAETLDALEVRLSPRFPLLGGWKTEYILGYNVPAHQFLYRTGSKFTLRMRIVDHIYDDQVVEHLTLKIVLPEMVSDIEFIPPFSVTEQPREVLKTYLDTVGRTVLVFTAKNLVTEHILDFTLNYRFNMLLMLREPLMLITAFCIIFVCVLIYVRLDFSIFRDEKAELRMRAQAIVDEAQELYKRRTYVYQSYEDAINRYKASKDATQFATDRRKLDAEHKEINQTLARVQTKLSELCLESSERLKEVMAMDVAYRDLLHESAQQAERVLTGKITKQQYQTADSDTSVKKADLIGRMDAAMDSL